MGESDGNPTNATKWVPIEVTWGNYRDDAQTMEEVIEARENRLKHRGIAAEPAFKTKWGKYVLRCEQSGDTPFPSRVYEDIPNNAERLLQIQYDDFYKFKKNDPSILKMFGTGARIRAVCHIPGEGATRLCK